MKYKKEDLIVKRLTPDYQSKIDSFECYEQELVDFLKEDALSNQKHRISVTYLFFSKETEQLVGYLSVLNDSINLTAELKSQFRGKGIHYKSLPALKVGRVAVANECCGKGIGTHMMNFAIFLATKTYNSLSGCRFITLDAKKGKTRDKDSIHFYKKLGFKVLKERKKGTTPMYLDLYLANE